MSKKYVRTYSYTIFGFDVFDVVRRFKPLAQETAPNAQAAVKAWVERGHARRPEQVVAALNPGM